MRRVPKRKLAALGLALALTFAVAACGSSGGSGTVQQSAIPSKPEPGVIRMGIEPWIGYGPWYIAEQKGYFKKNGIDVKIVNFSTDAQRESAFVSGKTDVSNMPTHAALLFEQQGVPAKIVLLEDESLTADAVIAKPPITSIKDLNGQKVAYEEGTTSDILIHYALAANGMSADDIQKVPIPASDAGNAALAGKVSAAVTYEPYISAVLDQNKGFKRIYNAGVDPGLISDVLVAHNSMIDDNPGQIEALVKSWQEAIQFYNSHPAQAQAIITKADGAKPGSLASSFKGVKLYSVPQNEQLLTGTFATKTAVDVRDAALASGYLKDKVDPKTIIQPAFVNAANQP
jgi:NitT/TauT family transport system substrate-binding protein